jgi:hypothetical protein
VAQGTPEEIAACDASHTGRALREVGVQASGFGALKNVRSKSA